jgi:hypothetical protein
VPIVGSPVLIDAVPFEMGTGRPKAVLPSKSCTWPVRLAPEDVTVTLKAKLLLANGCLAVVTVRAVCEAVCVPPPLPPPVVLPPPHPKVKLKTQTSARPSAERSCFRVRKPGNNRSKTEARPEAALSVHQEATWALLEFVGGITIAAA